MLFVRLALVFPITVLGVLTWECNYAQEHPHPSNRDIVYTVILRNQEANPSGWVQEIYVMEPDGENPRRLTKAERGQGSWMPKWSSDRKKISFGSDRDGEFRRYEMNANGSGVVTSTQQQPESRAIVDSVAKERSLTKGWTDLSPDGKQIVCSLGREIDEGKWLTNLFLIDADGSNVRQVTHDARVNYQACWSPDGNTIVFDSTRDDGDWDIYVMIADGSNPRRLTSHMAADARPVWSPDGKQIAFHSNRRGDKMQIYVMDADGSDLRQLTHHKGKGAVHPNWHPFNR